MAQVCEMLMLILFGLSWPFNIAKSWRSRTARGKSILFEVFVICGYLCGVAGKFLGDNVSYVVAFYGADILMVSVDLILTCRNRVLDHMAERKERAA